MLRNDWTAAAAASNRLLAGACPAERARPQGDTMGAGHVNLRVRKYRTGDEGEINRLFNLVFHETRSLEEWRLKFQGNPVGSSLITLAETDGKIVGQYAHLVIPLKFGGRIVRACQGVDNFVLPEYRRGGNVHLTLLASQPSLIRELGGAFGFGFPNEAAYLIDKWLLRCRDLFTLPTLFRRLNWRQAVKRRIPWLPGWIFAFIGWASNTLHRLSLAAKGTGDIAVSQVPSFDERIEAFWEKVKESYGILIVRDRQFLNWRYAPNPSRPYTFLMGEKDEAIVGYAVLTIRQGGDIRTGEIVDILTIDDIASEEALVRGALRWFLSRKADYVLTSALREDRISRTLSNLGFHEHPVFKPYPIVYSMFSTDLDEGFLKDARNWHLTHGDALDGV
jgi:hypothetical protein